MILPYIQAPENRVPELLGTIGDTLVSAAQRKQQEKRQAAEMLLRQREAQRQDQLAQAQIQNYASEAQMRQAQEGRIAAADKRQQGMDVANMLPKIKSMLTPGSPDYDPETAMSLARAGGMELQRVAPQAPPVEEGPRISPEDAQQAGLMTAMQRVPSNAPPAQGAAEDQRQIAMAEAERQRFAAANTQRPPTALATYQGTSPIGPISIDPNAALEARRVQQERLQPLAQSLPEQYQPTLRAMIAAGYDGKQIQQFITEAQKETSKDARDKVYTEPETERERHNRAMEAAAMAQARARGQQAGEGIDPEAALAVARAAQQGGSQEDVVGTAVRGGATKPITVAHKVMEQTDKQQQETVRDSAGNVIGRVPIGRGGAQGFATRDADYGRAIDQLQTLLDDVKAHGNRAVTDPLERSTKYENALGGVVTVSPMGKTNEAMSIEKGAIGPSGTVAGPSGGFKSIVTGANPEAIQRKINEVKAQRERYRQETLLPVQGTVGEQLAGAARKKAGVESPDARAARLAKILGVSQ